MPRGKWIDKKNAQHFTLVHRPQNDPLIHDTDAPSMVLNPTTRGNDSKVKKLDDLASEFGGSSADAPVRANEGEAANYGVYYDDTEYDYMQHLRDLDGPNTSGGDVVFVEADSSKNKAKKEAKAKQKQSLEDALRDLEVKDRADGKGELFEEDMLPSKNLQRLTYQNQQDVPDVIGGFQPDMDPRLREVLEALEDEAYVDDEDDIFQELAKDGRELDDIEFEGEQFFDEDEDDGWESDNTAKPTREYKNDDDQAPQLVPVHDADGAPVQNENWLEDFKKFKQDQKGGAPLKKPPGGGLTPSNADLQSSLFTTTTNGGRRKKRKGALTNPSAYSMTSSSLVRTEQLEILDGRFETMQRKQYDALDDLDEFPEDEENESLAPSSHMSTASSVTGPTRGDFDTILDDFLGGYHTVGSRGHMRQGAWKSGPDQLDEIRKELGPARLGNGKKSKQQQQKGRNGAAGSSRAGAAGSAASASPFSF